MDGKRKKANGMGKGREVGGTEERDEILRKEGKYWLCCYFGIGGNCFHLVS
jgi:hypothetical protein